MLTLETDLIKELVFKDYLNAKHFVNGFVAYTLSQAVIRVTSQDFGTTADLSNLVAMENYRYHAAYKDFLVTQDLTATFFYQVLQYSSPATVEKPVSAETTDNLLAKRQIDFMEYLAPSLELFFDELVKRVTNKFSNYGDKIVLVNADLATPGLLAVSYKTVMRTPQLLQEYQCLT